LFGGLLQGSEAIGKAGVELSKRSVIIPSIVEEKRIQLHAAFLLQFFSEGLDTIYSCILIIGSKVAEIVPGVVVKKRAIWARTFALNICQKVAPQLARMNHSKYGRIRNRLPRAKRQIAIDPCCRAGPCHVALRDRVLESCEKIRGYDR
jgi:hypothetical protein